MYETLTPWHECMSAWGVNPFADDMILAFLADIGIDGGLAIDQFTADYYDAKSWYNSIGEVQRLIKATISINRSKYDAMIAGLPYGQQRRKIRTPDITKTIDGSSTGTTTNDRRQTQTQIDTPTNYTSTRTHSVNPYDNPGWQDESKDVSVDSGSRTVLTSYSGDPDTMTNTATGQRTDTETGTETTTETITGTLNAKEAAEVLQMGLTVFREFERDLAAKLFVQLWEV